MRSPSLSLSLVLSVLARVDGLRVGSPPRMSFNPFDVLLDGCPLTGSRANPPTSPPATSPSAASSPSVPSVEQVIDDLEQRVISQAGMSQPLATAAAEQAIDSIVRATADELGTVSVSINASSSLALLVRGELLSASVRATGVSAVGLRATSVELASESVDLVIPSPFTPLPPNLKSPAKVRFSVRLTSEDLNSSPVLFGALQEVLRELVRTGVSAAIGEALPRDRSGLVINLVRVEPPTRGRLVLVADAEATQSDGSVVRLQGMRVRTTPRASTAERMVLLDTPELVSSFEGFGAKLEVGLPFLRAAGIPLPRDISITSLTVDDGAIACRGEAVLRPIDYDEISELVSAAAAAQQRQRVSTPGAVAVDVQAERDDDDDGVGGSRSRGGGPRPALPG